MDDHLPSLLEGARTREALSQGALAALLGVSQQTVSRWETGLSRPRKPMLGKLASVLDLSQEELRAAMDWRLITRRQQLRWPCPYRSGR